MSRLLVLCSVVASAILAVPLHAGSIFITGDVSTGTSTPLSDLNNGITATFTSNGSFQTNTSFFSWGPEMLSTVTPDSLTIAFDTPISSISLDFGTLNPEALDLAAFLGASAIGSNSLLGSIVGTYPEGIISFSGASFDSIVLSSSSDIFAVGNITVTAASGVPEPASGMLLVAGALLLALVRVRPSALRGSHRL